LVVDGSTSLANDDNAGTPDRPLRTVARAAEMAAANNLRGVATRIRIRPGIYRESVGLGEWRGQTSAPISFEGPTTGTAVLSGSDVWTGWTRVPSTDLYQHPWPFRWGPAPLPPGWETAQVPEIARRREMVFANGQLLRQVRSLGELAKTRGAFAVDEFSGLVTLRLPLGVDLEQAKIEVATRQLIFRIGGRTNVRISNLTFKHAASALQQPAVRIERSSNIQISNASFTWNNWTGLGLNDDRDITIRNSTMDHNGSMGVSALRTEGLSMDQTSNSYNAWRGQWGGWHGWENGMKFMGVHHAVLRRHTAIGNHSYGLWLDTDNSNILIEGSRICANLLAGVYLEASPGPITMKRVTICRNGNRGILASNASRVTIVHSRIMDNAKAQITLSGVQNGLPVTNWESGQALNVRSTHWTVKHNDIRAAPHQLVVESTWSKTTWAKARPSYAWGYNSWAGATNRIFLIPGTFQLGTLREWQARTGLDRGSTQRRSRR
jgi:hypothetical protein